MVFWGVEKREAAEPQLHLNAKTVKRSCSEGQIAHSTSTRGRYSRSKLAPLHDDESPIYLWSSSSSCHAKEDRVLLPRNPMRKLLRTLLPLISGPEKWRRNTTSRAEVSMMIGLNSTIAEIEMFFACKKWSHFFVPGSGNFLLLLISAADPNFAFDVVRHFSAAASDLAR